MTKKLNSGGPATLSANLSRWFVALVIVIPTLARTQEIKYPPAVEARISSENPPALELNWSAFNSADGKLEIYRKTQDSAGWGSPIIKDVNPSVGKFIDSGIKRGVAYEYKISNPTNTTVAAYTLGGIAVFPNDNPGKILLVVEGELVKDAGLVMDLRRLQADLISEGYDPVTVKVSRSESIFSARSKIKAAYERAPAITKTAILIGAIPVPRSGNENYDGHDETLGAWATDQFYADLDGEWTDWRVRSHKASYLLANKRNLPGDGRLDQDVAPSTIELQVGRVDFSRMKFMRKNALILTRQYLQKNHDYRYGALSHLIQQGAYFQEGLDGKGDRSLQNYRALFGAGSPKENSPYLQIPAAPQQAFQMVRVSGSGHHMGINALDSDPTHPNLSLARLRNNYRKLGNLGVFFEVYGSYMGDWESGDSFVNAALGADRLGLASVWSKWRVSAVAFSDDRSGQPPGSSSSENARPRNSRGDQILRGPEDCRQPDGRSHSSDQTHQKNIENESEQSIGEECCNH